MENISIETELAQPKDHILTLFETEYAYHVTNFCGEHQPSISVLKRNVAKDMSYDGVLVGLPCVFFSTSLFNRKLPTITPYPPSGKPNEFYWRISVPMTAFQDYEMMRCHNIMHPQERLVLKKDCHSFFETVKGMEPIDAANNPFLCRKNGTFYTNDWSLQKYFVNFVILEDFPLEFCDATCPSGCKTHCKWDQVERYSCGPGFPMNHEEFCNEMEKRWTLLHKGTK